MGLITMICKVVHAQKGWSRRRRAAQIRSSWPARPLLQGREPVQTVVSIDCGGTTMRTKYVTAIAAVAAVGCVTATAAPQVKATLPCTFGQSMEQDHMLDIQNTTKSALPAETIINLDITTKPNGEQFDCFALTAPLAPGAHLSHMEKVTVGTDGLMCKAFLSKKYPAISHGSDGSSSTQCDY
jgi:hypothetical protein